MSDSDTARDAVEISGGQRLIRGAIVIAMFLSPWLAFRWYDSYSSSCQGMVGDVAKLSADNKSALNPSRIIDVVQTSESSRQEKEIVCRGTAIWSDGRKTPISYRTYEEYGKWWLTYEEQ